MARVADWPLDFRLAFWSPEVTRCQTKRGASGSDEKLEALAGEWWGEESFATTLAPHPRPLSPQRGEGRKTAMPDTRRLVFRLSHIEESAVRGTRGEGWLFSGLKNESPF